MGHIPVISGLLIVIWTALLSDARLWAQAPALSSADLARMQAIVRDADELQQRQPAAVLERLRPLLEELQLLYQNAALTIETSRIYQQALTLQVRTQMRLQMPNAQVMPNLKQLLLVNPNVDQEKFFPLEKELLRNILSAEGGRLNLQSTPASATVLYMGQELGSTPLNVQLVAGKYRFLIRKAGYRDEVIDVPVQPASLEIPPPVLLRPSIVEIPVALNASNVNILVDGQTVGVSQGYKAWLSSLPSDRVQEYESIVRNWGVEEGNASFFRLQEIPLDKPVKLEFRGPCYEPLTMNIQIPEQEVDWTRRVMVRSELSRVVLKRDLGVLEVSSTPSGAEIWIDGNLEGKTPLKLDVCTGPHRLRVLHAAGQYVKEIVVNREQPEKIEATVKPSLAFLGIYSQDSMNRAPAPMKEDWETVARQISQENSYFTDLRLSPSEVQALRSKGDLRFEQLLDLSNRPANLEFIVRQLAFDAMRCDLFLLGLKTRDKYIFQVFSPIQPAPDVIEVPALDGTALGYLTSQLNKAANTQLLIRTPDLGMDLLDVPNGIAIMRVRPLSQAARLQLQPGMMIRSVEEKPMSLKQLQLHLQTLKPGQSIKLEVLGERGLQAVALPVTWVGTQYPWNSQEGYFNAVLATLRHLIEANPTSDEAKYAALGIALGLIERGNWKLALDYLGKASFEPQKPGIGLGTVLYYQGRCYEHLGDRALARNFYTRAREFAESTLGTPDGISVPRLAELRLEFLDQPAR